MSERSECQWMNKNRKVYKDEPCQICKGKVVVNRIALCPFCTETYGLIPELQHLVTADERLYSIQAGVRADKRR